MDLLTYLKNYEPYELVHFSGNTYTTKTHDSLKISNGKWMWWSRGIGGRSAVDYLIKVRGYTFMEAVQTIAGQAAVTPPVSLPAEKTTEKKLLLPKPNRYQTQAVSYLNRRGIDTDIIRFCLQSGIVYESENYHNAVFVGMDKGGKLFCALMGTFLLFLLFDVYEKNKKTAMETFNVNAITEEEITDELIIALFIEDITKEINAFYSEHYSGEIEVYNYEVSVLDIKKDKPGVISVKFGVTPQIGAHNPLGYDELSYFVDSNGRKSLVGYEHLRNYEVPERFQKFIISYP